VIKSSVTVKEGPGGREKENFFRVQADAVAAQSASRSMSVMCDRMARIDGLETMIAKRRADGSNAADSVTHKMQATMDALVQELS
jgi:hypothetical protein